jgi:hypothetical protein
MTTEEIKDVYSLDNVSVINENSGETKSLYENVSTIIIPDWVHDAVKRNHLPITSYFHEKELLNILSKSDVDFYFNLQGYCDFGFEHLTKDDLFGYFLDSTKVDAGVDKLYATYNLLTVIDGVEYFSLTLNVAEPEENVSIKRLEGLKHLITNIGYLSDFSEIAKSDLLNKYLKEYKNTLP